MYLGTGFMVKVILSKQGARRWVEVLEIVEGMA
jgi:hypothetical protein